MAGLGSLIVVCTQDNLSVNFHILLHCEVASFLWTAFVVFWHHISSAFLCEGCSGLLVWQFCRQKYRKVWNLALLSKSWCMWEKHNRKLFGLRWGGDFSC